MNWTYALVAAAFGALAYAGAKKNKSPTLHARDIEEKKGLTHMVVKDGKGRTFKVYSPDKQCWYYSKSHEEVPAKVNKALSELLAECTIMSQKAVERMNG